MLLAAAALVHCVQMLMRLRQHYRVVEAAERLEVVNLSHVVRLYVPREHQTNRGAEEMVLAKQGIEARRLPWRRRAFASAALTLAFAGLTTFLAHRPPPTTPVVPTMAKARPSVDALAAIEGVWGWRANATQSCDENPQAISVSADHTKLSVRYSKPLGGPGAPTKFDYDVVSKEPNMLVLAGPLSPDHPNARVPQVTIRFLDTNTYTANVSNRPFQSTGAVERCQ